MLLAGALHLDELAAVRHHDVEVDGCAGVLLVAEVEHRLAADEPHARGRDAAGERHAEHDAVAHEAEERLVERDVGAGDGGGARAAVGLQDVAVDGDGALAELRELGYGAEGAADEALYLVGAPAAGGAFAGGAGERGAREHPVLGGHPALALAAQEEGGLLLDGRGADDARQAGLHEDGALGELLEAGGDLGGAQFVVAPAVDAGHGSLLAFTCPAGRGRLPAGACG